MDDDGRSGRWMAGGNMGKLTHLEAFLSDDAKRGREWTDGIDIYRRNGAIVEFKTRTDERFTTFTPQLCLNSFGSEVVTWSDEPKVDYPLTFDEAWPECARKRALIECELTPGVLFGLNENNCRYRMEPNKGFRSGWQLESTERDAKWRIVDGGK